MRISDWSSDVCSSDLLAAIECRLRQRGIEEDERLCRHAAILDEAERQGGDSAAPGDVGRRAAEMRDRIGEARAVHVQPEPTLRAQRADRSDLGWGDRKSTRLNSSH